MYRITTRHGETEHETLKQARKYMRSLTKYWDSDAPITLTYPDDSQVSGTLGEMTDPTSEAKLVRYRTTA